MYDGDKTYFLEDNPGLVDRFEKNLDLEWCEEIAEQEGFGSCDEMLGEIINANDLIDYFYGGNEEEFFWDNEGMIKEFINRNIGNYVNKEIIEELEDWCLENERNLKKCIEALEWHGEYAAAEKLMKEFQMVR